MKNAHNNHNFNHKETITLSGLVQKPPSPTPYVPPTKNDWEILFPPLFDEYFNPPPSIAFSKFCHLPNLDNDPFFGVLIPELNSEESSSPIGIFLNQSKYALEIIKKYGMESSNPVDTLMVEKSKLDEDPQGKAVDPTRYRRMMGSLMYRTPCNFCMDVVLEGFSSSHYSYADADHAGGQIPEKVLLQYEILGDQIRSVVTSKKQKSITISSTEVEYIALSGCCAQILWMRSKLIEYGLGSTKFLCIATTKVLLPYAVTTSNIQDLSISTSDIIS
ncbi:hypothetical protein Tco_0071137 [Tanacetum coccineum]